MDDDAPLEFRFSGDTVDSNKWAIEDEGRTIVGLDGTDGGRYAFIQPVFTAGGSSKSHTVEVKVAPPPPSFNNEDDEGVDPISICYIGVGPFMGADQTLAGKGGHFGLKVFR